MGTPKARTGIGKLLARSYRGECLPFSGIVGYSVGSQVEQKLRNLLQSVRREIAKAFGLLGDFIGSLVEQKLRNLLRSVRREIAEPFGIVGNSLVHSAQGDCKPFRRYGETFSLAGYTKTCKAFPYVDRLQSLSGYGATSSAFVM